MTEEMKEADQSKKPLSTMTVKELREIARQIPEITGISAMKKEHLLAAVMEAKGMKDQEPATEGEDRSGRLPLSAGDLKKRMAHLRAEKELAQKKGNRKEVDVLRRRINRLKKQTRKIAGKP